MLKIETIHHVSLPVSDLERAKRFYEEVLGLAPLERPPFDFPGAWYQAGDRQLHLIVHDHSTFREGKPVDSRDGHFALRVGSYEATRAYLRSKGFHPEAEDELKRMKENPRSTAGWPQLYIMDPDRNVIELNAERLAGF
ncbi:MAG: VOC family protein [Chloroflexi bacterium]|nr:VOC family protein [Chloroflexota bacterium]MCI0577195.1 VOC family protein [Chloroflexota bacterium]MCI0649095.1 VOC family protein [Chloroflexota bacterium]MCI0727003.1 VOC family protein [Chloroflexota bacterium]